GGGGGGNRSAFSDFRGYSPSQRTARRESYLRSYSGASYASRGAAAQDAAAWNEARSAPGFGQGWDPGYTPSTTPVGGSPVSGASPPPGSAALRTTPPGGGAVPPAPAGAAPAAAPATPVLPAGVPLEERPTATGPSPAARMMASDLHARQQMELISYGVGFQLGIEVRARLGQDGLDPDHADLLTGFDDGLRSREPRLTRAEIDDALAALHERVNARDLERLLGEDPAFKKLHDDNLERSRKLHETFGAGDTVVTMPDGLQYEVLVDGDGEMPAADATVIIDYRLMDYDGEVIGEKTGHRVVLRDAVVGMRRVLTMMRVGSRWTVAIPPELAFGAAGHPPELGPNQSLYAEVELVSIEPTVDVEP
ncbi:MAG: FKBP-type peptidyl-prolyl cis-trans isomerase, partial [Planctomycetota bacterium]